MPKSHSEKKVAKVGKQRASVKNRSRKFYRFSEAVRVIAFGQSDYDPDRPSWKTAAADLDVLVPPPSSQADRGPSNLQKLEQAADQLISQLRIGRLTAQARARLAGEPIDLRTSRSSIPNEHWSHAGVDRYSEKLSVAGFEYSDIVVAKVALFKEFARLGHELTDVSDTGEPNRSGRPPVHDIEAFWALAALDIAEHGVPEKPAKFIHRMLIAGENLWNEGAPREAWLKVRSRRFFGIKAVRERLPRISGKK